MLLTLVLFINFSINMMKITLPSLSPKFVNAYILQRMHPISVEDDCLQNHAIWMWSLQRAIYAFLPQLFNVKINDHILENNINSTLCKIRPKVTFNLTQKQVSMITWLMFRLHKELKLWCKAHAIFDIKSILTFGFDGDRHLTYKGKQKQIQPEDSIGTFAW